MEASVPHVTRKVRSDDPVPVEVRAARSVVRPQAGVYALSDLQRLAGNAAVTALVTGVHGRSTTRDPTGESSEETTTRTAGVQRYGDGAGAGAPPENGVVASGPAYGVGGSVPVTTAGSAKRAPFSFNATFVSDLNNGIRPSCCEVRQYIKWNEAYQNWHKGKPPHGGFPSSASAGTWYEDRDVNDKRYGHRSGAHSDPIAGGHDEYTTGGVRDQTDGDTYSGRDAPKGPLAMTGQWQFLLTVVDTCNTNAERARSSVITVNW
jgi:hypothetical protein